MKCVGYVCVTGAEEAESPALLDDQEGAIHDFAAQAGLHVVKVYRDNGVEGGPAFAATRGGVIQLLDDSTNGAFTMVLVATRRRIARDHEVGFDVCAELRDLGKQVVIVDETPDPRPIAEAALARARAASADAWPTAPERTPASMRAGVLETPSSLQARRSSNGRNGNGNGRAPRETAAARGVDANGKRAPRRKLRAQSGPAPYGYVREPIEGRRGRSRLVVETKEAETVRLIFREYLRKRSMKKLIEFLEGKKISTRRGRRWSRAAIAWILKNDTYLGKVHAGGDRYRGTHEPIIAPIIFNKVQQLLRKNNKRKNEKPQKAAKPAKVAETAKAPDKAAEPKKAPAPVEAEVEAKKVESRSESSVEQPVSVG